MDMDAEEKFCDSRIQASIDRRKVLAERVEKTCASIKHIWKQKISANEMTSNMDIALIKEKEKECEDGLETLAELDKEAEALAFFQLHLDQEKYKIQQQIRTIDLQIASKREEFSIVFI